MEYNQRDLLEVTAHLAVLIGSNWDDLYNGDSVDTTFKSIEWAKEFLKQYEDDGDTWLDAIEEFFNKKLEQAK